MATYVLMTKLTPEVTSAVKNREKIGKAWLKKVSEVCPEVKWLNHYALLGPYDFMDIYEAPDDETAAKVSWMTLSAGALSAESWPAIPWTRYLEIIDDVS